MPTDKQVDAAHDAWERITQKWRIERRGRHWIVQDVGDSYEPFDATVNYADAIAAYRFDDEKTARFHLRDMVLRAVLEAADKTR